MTSSRIGAGRFRNPTDAAGLMALRLLGRPAEQDPVALPVFLLRIVARRENSGVLTLRQGSAKERGGKSVELSILEGMAHLGERELAMVLEAFTWPEGSYAFGAGSPSTAKRNRYPMAQLTMKGLRVLARRFDAEEMEKALGERLSDAPLVRPDRAKVIAALGLTDRDARLLKNQVDGKRSALAVAGTGIGRLGTLQLLILLDVFDCLQWKDPVVEQQMSLAKELEASLAKLKRASHFEVLKVHWGATSAEIGETYRKACAQLARGGRWAQAAPEVCAEMRVLVDAAFAVLADPADRAAYRYEVYPDLDYESATQFLEGRIKALQLRSDQREAEKVRERLNELRKMQTGRGSRRRS